MSRTTTEEKHIKMFFLGFLLILLGMILIMISIFLSLDTATFGGIIIIGPIPIIIGVGHHVLLVILVAFVLTIISILFFIWLQKRVTK